MPEPSFCADASRARGEPLYGTASTVRRWLLVERDGPWGADAVADNRFPARARGELARLGRRLRARVLLFKRHGRHTQRGVRCFAAFTGRGRRWLERLRFDDLDGLLAHDLSPLRRGESVGGAPVDGLRMFVCTHGKHDACCAVRGREVAAALHADEPDTVFECSHIGGDRFAANVLVLPLGLYLGRVPAERAGALAAALREGRLDLDCYRGRTCYPFDAQAAEWLVRERLSLDGVDDLELVTHERPAPGVVRSRFWVAREDREVVAELSVSKRPAAKLTCRAAAAAAAPAYELVRLEG